MDISELKTLVEERQRRRQTFIALSIGVGILGVFFIFSPKEVPPPTPVAQATTTAPDAYANINIHAKAAIVYDLTDNSILFERNAETQLPLASLTKLITLNAAVKALSPDSVVTISPTAIAQEGDYGLKVNERFAFADLARFTLVASSNDGAEAIAEAASNQQSIAITTLLSNAVAAAGLSQTYALNGTGLDVNTTLSGGYGTAHDVVILASKLLATAPSIASATIEPSITVKSLDNASHTQLNTNQDVPHLPRLLFSKTGYTDLAGGNLVIIYDAGLNHPIAIAVLGSTQSARFTDVDTLVAATIAHFSGVTPK